MDIMSILGLLMAVILVLFGIMFDTNTMKVVLGNLNAFISYPSLAITVGGTIGVMMLSFPASSFRKIGKHLKIVFRPKKFDPGESIRQIVELATEARMKGLLSLEDKLMDIDDPFLYNSLMLVVDSVDLEKVRGVMETELEQFDERHALDRSFYEKAASYAPAFGMIGTLVGLVLMLGNMNDVNSLAAGMATALITTFYGSLMANVICLPIASKLKVRHDEEFLCKQLIMEGVLAIQEGENPKFIEEKLYKLLPAGQKLKLDQSRQMPEDEEPVKGRKAKKQKKEK
ncbi:motility protein A [Diplocloster agilis]|uniref:Motility protein A n=1 Tax=Diplocloster agilis TaxID=2850323 RepID=A0A949K8S0_9FIRM|nr:MULTISPECIES: motility protein A [Lachnospiraceae]MBU9739288.1 motility protein A [Diplocloster agilis]MBU9744671.1 motility protein A [Diplocloster agilis]MCU6734546.1 motility protein A [Suonthocola fibrivorans]SCJ44212.1 Chemotaxis protein MotA [uncultured Clostridium sp.]